MEAHAIGSSLAVETLQLDKQFTALASVRYTCISSKELESVLAAQGRHIELLQCCTSFRTTLQRCVKQYMV